MMMLMKMHMIIEKVNGINTEEHTMFYSRCERIQKQLLEKVGKETTFFLLYECLL